MTLCKSCGSPDLNTGYVCENCGTHNPPGPVIAYGNLDNLDPEQLEQLKQDLQNLGGIVFTPDFKTEYTDLKTDYETKYIKAHLEHLWHFSCPCGRWFSISEWVETAVLTCPSCGAPYEVRQ